MNGIRSIGGENLNPKFISFGNCLLDISIETSDNYVLEKHSLNEDDQCEVSIEKLTAILKDAERYTNELQYNVGGSALNTTRILKTLGEFNVMFFGSIGDDNNGVILTKILKEQFLHECLQIISDSSTGICVCLISGSQRCLCANIGASLNFQKSFLENHNNQWFSEHENQIPQIYYIEGYFLPNKFNICKMIYEKYCKSTINLLAINLNASYICKKYPEEIRYLVEVADFVFANHWELNALNEICGYTNSEKTIEYFFSKYSKTGKRKILIITNSCYNVKTYVGSKYSYKLEEYPVLAILPENIIDTTGAGDSFVAGFLYAYLRKSSLQECVRYGCEIANKVIGQIGCKLPNEA